MSDFISRSFWLGESDYEPGPSLSGDIKADVAIIGGGFTGLWTATQLKKADPNLSIVVLESQVVGYGASGRNGGFAMTLLHMTLNDLVRYAGIDDAKSVYQAVARAVNGIEEFCKVEKVDCHLEKNGLLVVATSDIQRRSIQRELEAARLIGTNHFRALNQAEVLAEVHSPTYLEGIEEEDCAIINPARLVRGLKRVVEGQGVKVYEKTQVEGWNDGGASGVKITTNSGSVRCDKAVLASNAYSVAFPQISRWVVPFYTYIILTEPLNPKQYESIGWAKRQGIEDKRNFVHYYRMTKDNRILWGGRDSPYFYGSGIGSQYDRHPHIFSLLEESFGRTFPQLKGIRFTHKWGGPVAITSRFVPAFGTMEGGRVHYGFGYCGHGVAPTHMGGRILRDLVLNKKTELTESILVRRRPLAYPPEPLRYMSIQSIRLQLLRMDEKGRKREKPWYWPILERLSRRS